MSYDIIHVAFLQAIAAAFACDQVQYHVIFITHSVHEVCALLLHTSVSPFVAVVKRMHIFMF